MHDKTSSRESFNLPMHMKIEINHPKNVSLPPKKIFKSSEQTQHHGNNPKPPSREKIPKLPKASPALQKNLNPSRKNLNFPEKLSFPKNSTTITEIISSTRVKSQPLPEKSQPLVNNSQSLLKKSQLPTS